MTDKQKEISLILLQYQLETAQCMQKYVPDKLGSDTFRAEMLALNQKFTLILDEVI